MGFLENCVAQPGTMRARIFSNSLISLPAALYYDLVIPLTPFMPTDPDLIASIEEIGGVDLPFDTEFSLEFIRLPEIDWRRLDGRTFEPNEDDQDGSIYLLSAHHPVIMRQVRFERIPNVTSAQFYVTCTLFCDYVYTEELGEAETLTLKTPVTFEGLSVNLAVPDATPEKIQAAIQDLVPLEAYQPEPQMCATSLFEFKPVVD